MTALSQCDYAVITIRTWNGSAQAIVLRRGDWAVHHAEEHKRHEIIHIASGMSLPCSFSTAEHCAAAMIDISRLRNDWAVFDLASITPELRRQVRGIVERHHGFWHPVAPLDPLAAGVYNHVMSEGQPRN